MKARERVRQVASDELREILGAWNDAVAREAFFKEAARRSEALDENERADLDARIALARVLAELWTR